MLKEITSRQNLMLQKIKSIILQFVTFYYNLKNLFSYKHPFFEIREGIVVKMFFKFSLTLLKKISKKLLNLKIFSWRVMLVIVQACLTERRHKYCTGRRGEPQRFALATVLGPGHITQNVPGVSGRYILQQIRPTSIYNRTTYKVANKPQLIINMLKRMTSPS